ncbi:MAG: PF20097 family protein [Candidatus Thorarchaeota archaeon]
MMILIGILASTIICLCYGFCSSSNTTTQQSDLHTMSSARCPSCNELMETGFLIAPEGITWSSELPLLRGEEIFEHHYRVTYSYVESYVSKKCSIIKYQSLEP